MHVHLDAIGGIAGDMFVASCLDAWPNLVSGLEPTLRSAGLPADWTIEVSETRSHGIAGTQIRFLSANRTPERPTGKYGEICDNLSSSSLEPRVLQRALAIFKILAQAESIAHGIPMEDVHFHEIADWDSVADIVGAAWVIESCSADSWSVSPIPIGSGTISTAHGELPIPAPATAYLIKGMEVVDDGVPGERITPTGAAILRYLNATAHGPATGQFGTTGHGLGTRDLLNRPNLLRLRTLHASPASDRWGVNAVTIITFEVDDQTPEHLAVGLETLRQHEAVLDLNQTTVYGKKGRVATQIQVLCRPPDRDNVVATCFEQTTTIGLRWYDALRAELFRQNTERQGVRGKVAVRPDASESAKPEIDDVAAATINQVERDDLNKRFLRSNNDET